MPNQEDIAQGLRGHLLVRVPIYIEWEHPDYESNLAGGYFARTGEYEIVSTNLPDDAIEILAFEASEGELDYDHNLPEAVAKEFPWHPKEGS